ncbi:MAG: flagellar hook-length control protein FliK [Pseudomonadota bacterium]|nr:flagellar hook-length control protein FliK [Pseudomonadota bacterium]
MINVDTVAIVLRVLGRGQSAQAPLPTGGIPRIPAVAALTDDRSLSSSAEGGAPTGRDPFSARDAFPTREPSSHSTLVTTAPTRMVPVSPELAPTLSRAGQIALSPGGALLLEALNLPESGPAIRPAAPLLASPPHEPAVLAHAIEHAIVKSGLFYESHVARWAAQEFPLANLREEPQASWSVSPSSTPAHDAAGPAATHPDAPLLVRQQLEAHEAHRVVLAAELWPGQHAKLQFEEAGHTREHSREVPELHEAAPWSVRIELSLPSLGPVNAVISLANGRVECRLNVLSRHAKGRLDEARQDLHAALQDHDLPLSHCLVQHD